MRIIITTLIVVLNFILQTTLFPYLAIQGVFPNTALIIVTPIPCCAAVRRAH